MANEDKRFWPRVNKTDACWLWTGLTNHGYGQFSIGSRRTGGYTTMRAHKWAWESVHGPVPEGLQLDHLCRVLTCVNPAHLEPVSPRENTLRSQNPAAVNARKTHCKHGHEFTVENTLTVRNRRYCRPCGRAKQARRYALQRESQS